MDIENNKKVGPIIFFVIFGVIILSFFVDYLEKANIGELVFLPYIIIPIVLSIIFVVVMVNKKKEDHGQDNTIDNHNKTFHKSEWQKLGIDKNDFAIDKNQYLKDIHKDGSKKVKQASKKSDELEENVKEPINYSDEIIKKVFSEYNDSEFASWRESFEARKNITYDPSKDE